MNQVTGVRVPVSLCSCERQDSFSVEILVQVVRWWRSPCKLSSSVFQTLPAYTIKRTNAVMRVFCSLYFLTDLPLRHEESRKRVINYKVLNKRGGNRWRTTLIKLDINRSINADIYVIKGRSIRTRETTMEYIDQKTSWPSQGWSLQVPTKSGVWNRLNLNSSSWWKWRTIRILMHDMSAAG